MSATWPTSIVHTDGVAWHDAPIPRRWHKCFVHTDGWIELTHVQRCACGAIRLGPSHEWADRNSRRSR